jgi:hypothetical protein
VNLDCEASGTIRSEQAHRSYGKAMASRLVRLFQLRTGKSADGAHEGAPYPVAESSSDELATDPSTTDGRSNGRKEEVITKRNNEQGAASR